MCPINTTLFNVSFTNLPPLVFLIAACWVVTAASADQPQKRVDPTANHAAYESITGERADDDKSVWDNFYKTRSNAFGKEPISFLKEHLHLVTKGHAFVPAMGEGRNALFLAKNGFQVEGVDISEVAVQKALADAKLLKVQMKASVEDLNQFHYMENHYELIVVCQFYQKSLVPVFKRSLKHGGYIIFYNKLDIQDDGPNGKTSNPDEFSVKSGELREILKDFQIKEYREYKDQGVKVAAILARKP